MMLIGITGGSGYIGTWLAKRFLEHAYHVRIIDTNNSPIILSNYEYVEADINDEDAISEAIKGCDVLYHLAAVVSKVRGLEDRRYCIQTNIGGTLNVLEACRKHDVNRIIYMGTSEVLGEPLFTPTDERHPRRPKTTYGITKCAGEDLCYEYYLTYGLNVVMPRLYMVYGVMDIRPIKYHNVIVKMFWNVFHGKPPVAYRGCIRTFLYINDCIDALYALLRKGKAGEIYDICDSADNAVTMEQLASKIIGVCGGLDLLPNIRNPPSTDTQVKLSSGYKAFVELGWMPKVDLDTGLTLVHAWMKKVLDDKGWL